MARSRSLRSAISSTIANPTLDPLDGLLRAMSEPLIQDELVRQQNYFNTAAAQRWADYTAGLNAVEDNRRYQPTARAHRGAFEIGGSLAKIVVHKRPLVARSKPLWSYRGIPVGLQPPVGVQFESPFRVIRCLRRKVRREVIFALKKNRKGAGARRRRRNSYSDVRC